MFNEYAIVFTLVLVLSFIPVIGPYFKLFNTLVHEVIGHAFTARLTGGRVESVHLFHDTGGLARFHHHKAGRILTILAGYPAASLISVLYIYFLKSGFVMELAAAVAVFLLISALFYIRNLIGMLWVMSVLGFSGALFYYTGTDYLTSVVIIIGMMLLIQAPASALTVCILSFSRSHHAGDADFLAAETKIPAPLWGIVFAGQALVCFAAGMIIWFSDDPAGLISTIISGTAHSFHTILIL
ncbi:M50 family metallopeptidase [Alteribacter natronophilus]|uniref:M50 family metallopeptidase n=1 Tax=Alteribacter natronophilus TaxID=2583810 RepID=UPI0014866520|nr:M50 family metallopeptidase [Alteribacter natronophilus]